jgi:hypothetical protein
LKNKQAEQEEVQQWHTTKFNIYNMNYKKIYNDLMVSAKNKKRQKSINIYYEAHHIKPRVFKGEGDCRNINKFKRL